MKYVWFLATELTDFNERFLKTNLRKPPMIDMDAIRQGVDNARPPTGIAVSWESRAEPCKR